jgi:hypothetical protein
MLGDLLEMLNDNMPEIKEALHFLRDVAIVLRVEMKDGYRAMVEAMHLHFGRAAEILANMPQHIGEEMHKADQREKNPGDFQAWWNDPMLRFADNDNRLGPGDRQPPGPMGGRLGFDFFGV